MTESLHTIDTTDVVNAMSRALGAIAAPGKLKGMTNEFNIQVLYHRREAGHIMFRFVTVDDLEIMLDFDMNDLAKQGRDYIDSRMQIVIDNLKDAREKRRQDRTSMSLVAHPPSDIDRKNGFELRNAINSAVKSGACH